MGSHSLHGQHNGRRPEPVQVSTPPWVPNSWPIHGPDSTWTEPGRHQKRIPLISGECERDGINAKPETSDGKAWQD